MEVRPLCPPGARVHPTLSPACRVHRVQGTCVIEAAGLPLTLPDRGTSVRFRATLVMPVPILRANACATGDTVVWEFEEEDLFGRGFEMKALASSR